MKRAAQRERLRLALLSSLPLSSLFRTSILTPALEEEFVCADKVSQLIVQEGCAEKGKRFPLYDTFFKDKSCISL